LCDAGFAAALPDRLAGAGRVVAGFAVAGVRVFAGVGRPEGVLVDFFRDFWDIRLPFDAFGGSTKTVLQLSSGTPARGPWLGKSDDARVWLQGIPSTTPLLVERAPGAT
jgi:hypothetical protein